MKIRDVDELPGGYVRLPYPLPRHALKCDIDIVRIRPLVFYAPEDWEEQVQLKRRVDALAGVFPKEERVEVAEKIRKRLLEDPRFHRKSLLAAAQRFSFEMGPEAKAFLCEEFRRLLKE